MRDLTPERFGNLSIQQLHTFCLMHERQSYAATARQLGLAVPTVWEQVKALERICGVALFERSGRGMAPTAAADRLLEIVEPLVVRLDSTLERLGSPELEVPASLAIAGGSRMLIEDFGEAFARFRTSYPDTRLRLLSADNEMAQDLVHAGTADVAFLLEPSPDQKRPGLVYQPSYEIDYLAVFPPRHRLAKGRNPSLRDLVAEPLIVGHAGTVVRQRLEQALHRHGLLGELRIAAETDNSAMTIACVHAGLGVGIVGGNERGPLTGKLTYASLRRHLGTARIASVLRDGRLLSRALEDFTRLVQQSGSGRERRGRSGRARGASRR